MQGDLLRFALVNLLLFASLFTAPKKHVLNQEFVLLLVDCVGHYGNDLAASAFFNLCVVSRSTPMGSFLELRSQESINQAQYDLKCTLCI